MIIQNHPSNHLYNCNYEYFVGLNDQLGKAFLEVNQSLEIKENSTNGFSVLFEQSVYISDFSSYIESITSSKSGILLPRLKARKPLDVNTFSISKTLGSTTDHFSDVIEIINFDEPTSLVQLYSTSICIGALSLISYINNRDFLAKQTSLLFLETSFVDLCLACYFIDFQALASEFKQSEITFEFIFGSSLQEVRNRFLVLTFTAYPTLPFGFNLFTDPRSTTINLLISNWFRQSDGYSQAVQHMNGFSDDFINMSINTLLNSSDLNYGSIDDLKRLKSKYINN